MPEPAPRVTPFDLVFGPFVDQRFPAVGAALEAGHADPFDRDAFLLNQAAVELIHALRPEEGLGEAMGEFAALVHLGYLYWHAGGHTVRLSETTLTRLVASVPAAAPTAGRAAPPAYYIQYPARRVWGAATPGAPPEPLDGCFVAHRHGELAAAALFGVHPERAGLTVVQVAGPRPMAPTRPDGSALFTPVLAGGAQAGLYSVTGMEELLELVWRGDVMVRGGEPAPGARGVR